MTLKKHESSNHSTNVSQSSSVRRHLQFATSTQVYFVLSLDDYSEEEIIATWLTHEDNESIQLTTLKTLKRIRRGKELDENKYCIRGLEHMRSSKHMEQRKVNKEAVWNAVLDEQRRQVRSGISDPEEISFQSIIQSKKPKEAAVKTAALDAAAASAFLGVEFKSPPPRRTVHKQQSQDQVVSPRCGSQTDPDKRKGRDAIMNTKDCNDAIAETKRRHTLSTETSTGTPSSSSNQLIVSFSSPSSDDLSEKENLSNRTAASRNVFNRVFTRVSRGLEGEAKQMKMNAKGALVA